MFREAKKKENGGFDPSYLFRPKEKKRKRMGLGGNQTRDLWGEVGEN